MIDTTKLRELAQKATPGPWHYFEYPKYKEHHVSLPIAGSGMLRALFSDGCETDNPAADAEYIAAANPATVLALLDEIDRLRADKAHVTTMLESTSKLLNDAIDLVEKKNSQLVRLRKIESAAQNLDKVKGRHHSEQAMNKLLETLKS